MPRCQHIKISSRARGILSISLASPRLQGISKITDFCAHIPRGPDITITYYLLYKSKQHCRKASTPAAQQESSKAAILKCQYITCLVVGPCSVSLRFATFGMSSLYLIFHSLRPLREKITVLMRMLSALWMTRVAHHPRGTRNNK